MHSFKVMIRDQDLHLWEMQHLPEGDGLAAGTRN
jgi:hypothetical protein